MAIQKKGNVDFLKDVTPTSLSSDSKDSTIVTDTHNNTSSLKEELRTKKKSLDNWGRPRKQLIEGVKEVSLTVQLPETLIKAFVELLFENACLKQIVWIKHKR